MTPPKFIKPVSFIAAAVMCAAAVGVVIYALADESVRYRLTHRKVSDYIPPESLNYCTLGVRNPFPPGARDPQVFEKRWSWLPGEPRVYMYRDDAGTRQIVSAREKMQNPVDGTIVAVKEGLAAFWTVTDDKVEVGYVFTAYRGDLYVGQLRVTQVMRDSASAEIMFIEPGLELKAGDQVTTRWHSYVNE